MKARARKQTGEKLKSFVFVRASGGHGKPPIALARWPSRKVGAKRVGEALHKSVFIQICIETGVNGNKSCGRPGGNQSF